VSGTVGSFGRGMPMLTDFRLNVPTKRTPVRVNDQVFVAAVVG
jgi:hypothetical protein